MAITTVLVRALDGATSEARVVRAPAPAAGSARTVVLVAPAMGVAAGYYDPVLEALAERGLDAVTLEHRGLGSSSVRVRRGVDFGYADLVREDWPPHVELARAMAAEGGGRGRVVVLGHSLGGQLASLFAAERPGALDAIALVASCTVDVRGWTGPSRYKLFAQTQIAAALARALGVFPGDRVGFGGRQPPRLITDWARQARRGRFELAGAALDHEAALRAVELDVLSVAIEGDDFAPRAACDRLVRKMPRARVRRASVAPDWPVKKAGDAHLKWPRQPGAVVRAIERFARGE